MKKRNSGLSLIEILVVITVFSILAILATRGVLLTLRGSRKSDALGSVRENVGYSFAVMERNLRNAQTLSCTSATRVDYTDQNDSAGYFSCENVGSSGYIASGSARLTSDQVNVTSCSFTCEAATTGVPPAVDIDVTAQDANTQGAEGGQVTVQTRINLRTY